MVSFFRVRGVTRTLTAITILFLLIFIGAFSCGPDKNTWSSDHLKGEVKSILTERVGYVEAAGHWIEQRRRRINFDTYDTMGDRIESTDYEVNGTFKGKRVDMYDASGNLIEMDIFGIDGNLSGKSTYAYDVNGNLVESADFKARYCQSWWMKAYPIGSLSTLPLPPEAHRQQIDGPREPAAGAANGRACANSSAPPA